MSKLCHSPHNEVITKLYYLDYTPGTSIQSYLNNLTNALCDSGLGLTEVVINRCINRESLHALENMDTKYYFQEESGYALARIYAGDTPVFVFSANIETYIPISYLDAGESADILMTTTTLLQYYKRWKAFYRTSASETVGLNVPAALSSVGLRTTLLDTTGNLNLESFDSGKAEKYKRELLDYRKPFEAANNILAKAVEGIQPNEN